MSCGLFVVFLQLIIYLLVGCQVLADIELAQELESESEKKKEAQVVIIRFSCMHCTCTDCNQSKGEEVDHPLDINYGLLNCSLQYVDPSSKTFKVLFVTVVVAWY